MRILSLFLALHLPVMIFAQKQDYIWIIGDNNNLIDTTHGGAIIDFSQTPIKAKYHYRELNMFIANASICDTAGHLLFYTNGCDIAGNNDSILQNGEDLNPGAWHNILCDQNGGGYGSAYPGIMILPKPDSQKVFFIFHQSIKYGNNPVEYAFVNKLLHTVVRQTDENSLSCFVEEKNKEVMADSIATGEMNAVKHANGKDWWIIVPRRNSNQFNVFLLTKNGIVDTLTQTIGDFPPANMEIYGQTVFSPDGDRMVRYYPYTNVMNYTFDRNTGFFTQYSEFEVNYGSDFAPQGGCAISPNGRYLYITALLQVYQFDLWASDIPASQIKVATWDGFVDPIAIAFLTCQLGPDCKIYILGGGDTRYYHIIHNPDEQGLACNVEQRGLVLPTPSGASSPYFPNYRLGPIDDPGLPCSPTVATQQPAVAVPACSVWPNPASEQLHFALSEGNIKRILLTDAYGRVVRDLSLSGGSQSYTLSLGNLPGGVYFWVLEGDKGGGSGKVVVQR